MAETPRREAAAEARSRLLGKPGLSGGGSAAARADALRRRLPPPLQVRPLGVRLRGKRSRAWPRPRAVFRVSLSPGRGLCAPGPGAFSCAAEPRAAERRPGVRARPLRLPPPPRPAEAASGWRRGFSSAPVPVVRCSPLSAAPGGEPPPGKALGQPRALPRPGLLHARLETPPSPVRFLLSSCPTSRSASLPCYIFSLPLLFCHQVSPSSSPSMALNPLSLSLSLLCRLRVSLARLPQAILFGCHSF